MVEPINAGNPVQKLEIDHDATDLFPSQAEMDRVYATARKNAIHLGKRGEFVTDVPEEDVDAMDMAIAFIHCNEPYVEDSPKPGFVRYTVFRPAC